MRDEDRAIAALAVPAFGALVAEPLFVLVDSAIVGHLGTDALAGLGAAGTILTTAVGLCIFLAYATTAAVSRLVGAGEPRRALAQGIDGCWLAVGLGVALAGLGWGLAGPLASAIGAHGGARSAAVDYLQWSIPGLPGMLLVLAATGVLRGVADARTPLLVAAVAAVANAGLNWLLVYPAGMGVAGSGLGTAVVQLGAGSWLGWKVATAARRAGAPLVPTWAGVLASARTGTALLIRTAALRACLVVTAFAAASLGPAQLAAHQVTMAIWSFLALALDAVAIAAQTLVGTALGAGDVPRTRQLLHRMTRWGTGFGVVVGLTLFALHAVLGPLFTTDHDVQRAIGVALLAAAVGQPLSGYVFVLDGVLMGAADVKFLAVASIITTACYIPAALLVLRAGPGGDAGLGWIWLTFAVGFLGVRAVLLGWRARGDAWAVTGSVRR